MRKACTVVLTEAAEDGIIFLGSANEGAFSFFCRGHILMADGSFALLGRSLPPAACDRSRVRGGAPINNAMEEIMEAIINYLSGLDTLWTVILRVALAMLIGGVIGMERGKQGRAAGMRTHILVCIGATLTAMTGLYVNQVLGYDNDPLRISAQVISGIGFLGVGTILIKGRFQITGLTTAAGLWTAATIGIALGVGFYEGAIATFLACTLAVTIMHRLEFKITRRQARFGIYVEISEAQNVRKLINHLNTNYKVTDVQVTPPRSGISGNVGIEANVHAYDDTNLSPSVIAEQMEALPEVVYSIESI